MTGARLDFSIMGPAEGSVLVLGNSLGTTSGMWDAVVPALTAHLRVVRFDHRGHGRSEQPPPPYSIADLTDDVLALLDSLELPRVSYAGLSLGGMVGMALAARAPERVNRLALLCTSARTGPREMWLDRAAQVRREGTACLVDGAAQRWFTLAFREREPQEVARALAMLAQTRSEGYAGCCEAIADMDLRGELGAIRAPTLVIAGREDPATPPEHAEAIQRGVSGARLVVLPDAAHLAAVEQPAAISRLLLEHLVP